MITNNIKYLFLLAAVLILGACSSDDDNATEEFTGTNMVRIEFDNGFGGDDLLLGASTYRLNGESLTIDRFNYLVSNFVLIDREGNEYTYPKDESYFVISQENDMTEIRLTNIPAGEYVGVRFGVGVDQEKYQQGAAGQNDEFLRTAEDNEMMWSWQAGYKFLNFEGRFTSETVTEPTDFKIHMGSHGTALDNYRELRLDFPSEILVSDALSPVVHLMIDASKILDAEHEIRLSEAPVIMIDEVKSPQISENTSSMFQVDHVHNGENINH